MQRRERGRAQSGRGGAYGWPVRVSTTARPLETTHASAGAALRQRVADITGQYRYVVDQVLDDLIERCEELDLHLTRTQRETHVDAAVLLTVRVMNSLQEGYHLYSR